MSSGPRPNSLTGRIEAFFRAAPDEWLDFEAATLQFNCTQEEFQRAKEYLNHTGRINLRTISVVCVGVDE